MLDSIYHMTLKLNNHIFGMKMSTFCHILPLEHSAILLTCIMIIGLENQIVVFLRVAILQRFYCTFCCHFNQQVVGHFRFYSFSRAKPYIPFPT